MIRVDVNTVVMPKSKGYNELIFNFDHVIFNIETDDLICIIHIPAVTLI